MQKEKENESTMKNSQRKTKNIPYVLYPEYCDSFLARLRPDEPRSRERRKLRLGDLVVNMWPLSLFDKTHGQYFNRSGRRPQNGEVYINNLIDILHKSRTCLDQFIKYPSRDELINSLCPDMPQWHRESQLRLMGSNLLSPAIVTGFYDDLDDIRVNLHYPHIHTEDISWNFKCFHFLPVP